MRDRKLMENDTHKVAFELKHLGLRSLVEALQSGGSPEDALYEASEAVKQGLTRARDLLPADEAALKRGFDIVSERLKLRAVEDRLQFIAREIANSPGGTSELTTETRDLLTEQGELLLLKQRLKSKK